MGYTTTCFICKKELQEGKEHAIKLNGLLIGYLCGGCDNDLMGVVDSHPEYLRATCYMMVNHVK